MEYLYATLLRETNKLEPLTVNLENAADMPKSASYEHKVCVISGNIGLILYMHIYVEFKYGVTA